MTPIEFRRAVVCPPAACWRGLSCWGLPRSPAGAADITLTETGSTLLKPLFDIWVPEYLEDPSGRADHDRAAPDPRPGEQQALSGQVMIGASDAYMSDAQVRANPHFVDIPLAISAQTINYQPARAERRPICGSTGRPSPASTPGRSASGTRRAIAALNPGVALPHQDDHSGAPRRRLGRHLRVHAVPDLLDPVAGRAARATAPRSTGRRFRARIGVEGNAAMVQAHPGDARIPSAMSASATAATSPRRQARHRDAEERGRTVRAAHPGGDRRRRRVARGAHAAGRAAEPRVYAPGDQSYPLVNYEYVVVSTQQANPEVAAALRRFLPWIDRAVGGERGVPWTACISCRCRRTPGN